MKFYLLIIWLLIFSSNQVLAGSKKAPSVINNKLINDLSKIDQDKLTDKKSVIDPGSLHKPKFINPLPLTKVPDDGNIIHSHNNSINSSLPLKDRKLLINGKLPKPEQLESLSVRDQITLQRIDRQNSIEKVFNKTFKTSPLKKGKFKF